MLGLIADLTPEQLQSGSEEQLIQLLLAMHETLPLPVLTQLERGQMDGLTVEETETLKRKVGWPTCS
jgi:hypothetical protein